MDLVSGTPFWPERTAAPEYPTLRESLECDVAIIGGGITGALVANELCAAGLAAVVVDKRDIGAGSTCATTGLLQYETDIPLHQLIGRVGRDRALRSYRRGVEAIESLARLAKQLPSSVGFSWRGSLFGASRRSHVAGLREEYLSRRRHGLEVEYWDRREVERRSSLPFFAAIASRCAAEVDAYRLTHALFRHGRARGLQVFARTTIRQWRPTRHGVTLSASNGRRIVARSLVVAAGYEADDLLSGRCTRLHSTYALVTEPVRRFAGWPGRRVIWETGHPYLYWRTTADSRVMMGGADVPFRNPRLRDGLLPRKTRYLQRKLRDYFPALDCAVAHSWAGTFAETKDGLPFIGPRHGVPRIYYALGYGGNGITFSQIAAEILRDLCLGKPSPDLALFGFDR